ncbi:MAG: hypothetical protein DRP56_07580, partial [Planctomycetota bacterium]
RTQHGQAELDRASRLLPRDPSVLWIEDWIVKTVAGVIFGIWSRLGFSSSALRAKLGAISGVQSGVPSGFRGTWAPTASSGAGNHHLPRYLGTVGTGGILKHLKNAAFFRASRPKYHYIMP